ncbi:MAG: TM2 domain-containing protein, partial [Alphaproteobacteria bacterium]|nr:TM2 domain-containing protein [Alphaproteobacteria bacterium]
MPDLQFVLPHWLYWAGLVLFPLAAMALVKWQGRSGPLTHVSLPIGYLLLVTAGFVGAHRFYVRDWRGVLFLPLLATIIYANGAIRDAREMRSIADSDIQVAAYDVEYGELDVADGREGAEEALVAAHAALDAANARLATAEAGMRLWSTVALYVAIAVALVLLLDAVLLPGMVRRCRAAEGEVAPAGDVAGEAPSPTVEGPAAVPPPNPAEGPEISLCDKMRASTNDLPSMLGVTLVACVMVAVQAARPSRVASSASLTSTDAEESVAGSSCEDRRSSCTNASVGSGIRESRGSKEGSSSPTLRTSSRS